MRFGIWELLIILAIVVFIFGTKRLRDAGGDIGAAIKGFKKAVNDENKQLNNNNAKDNDSKHVVIDQEQEKEQS